MFRNLKFFRTGLRTPEKLEVERFQDLFSDFVTRCRGGGAVRYTMQDKRILTCLFLDPKLVENDLSDEDEDMSMSTDGKNNVHETQGLLTVEFLESEEDMGAGGPASEEGCEKKRRLLGETFTSILASPTPLSFSSLTIKKAKPGYFNDSSRLVYAIWRARQARLNRLG
jgi:hypothetical protein